MTDTARRVIELAKTLAGKFHHDRATDQHVFLALLHLTNGMAHEVLVKMDIRPDVKTFVEARLRVGVSGSHLSLGGVVTAAADQALRMNSRFIGSEHLLLAVLKTEPQRQAARQVLKGIVGPASEPTSSAPVQAGRHKATFVGVLSGSPTFIATDFEIGNA
jgi:ATP-dependent Clp protease ATP-binding subunit ClpA